jgi:hypothetical protein
LPSRYKTHTRTFSNNTTGWKMETLVITETIKHCILSQRFKRTQQKKTGFFQKFPNPPDVLHSLTMDLVGPMGPEYPRKVFSVVVDRLTRFIWTKDYHGMPTSKDLINKITNFQLKKDKKRIHVIHSNQGSQF